MKRTYHKSTANRSSVAILFTIFLTLLGTTSLYADSLPLVTEASWTTEKAHFNSLLTVLRKKTNLLNSKQSARLDRILKQKPDRALEEVQKLLDARCLLGVKINPESRVKVQRGTAQASLTLKKPSFFLIKVENNAGITASLQVQGEQLRAAKKPITAQRWLEAKIVHPKPLQANLSGIPCEYLLLQLTPHQSGKREATLKLDAGQGTQDLGFRAEVPILFRIHSPK